MPRDLAGQFFLEGMTLAGVLGGCALGFGLTTAIVFGWDAQAEPNLTLVVISLGVSLGSGTLASAVPAIMAARVEPATALHR